MDSQQQYFTVRQVAERLAVNSNKVLRWIGSGELPAVDVSQSKNDRPRWRLHLDDIERFELGRRSIAPPPPKPSRRRKPHLIEYVK